ncbi:histidine phosphatase family protein [Sphingomonas sp. PB2P19]|uniref:histidine phosphatase family protein n=1 Tax=Sphingomonas rhamnosi TaxID=3096156 RepID=UPI003FA78A9B
MRHAHSPTEAPTPSAADPANTKRERQLDAEGKIQARQFGQATRKLGLRFRRILRSPAFRARQTVRHAGLREPEIVQILAMSDQQTMMVAADGLSGGQLRALAAQRPRVPGRLPDAGGPSLLPVR